MKKITAFILAALMMAAAFAGCSNGGNQNSSSNSEATGATTATDTSWDDIKAKGKLVLGLDVEFPPMGYKDTETGEIIGFDIDLAKEVTKRLGIELEIQPIVWDNKEFELNGGNIDCIWNGMSYTDQRNEEMCLTPAYMTNNQIIITKADSELNTKDDLKGKTLGVQNKSSAESALNEAADFKATLGSVVGVESYTSAILELKNGTMDCIAIDEIVARYYIATEPDAYKVIKDGDKDFSLAAEDYVIGFRKADKALMNKIYDTLKEMKADGKLAEISEKWFDSDITVVK
ncbi:MAG: amino acid ABC transporter substrate-binding protein [Acutalibacteraceae bacterium]